MAGNNLRIIYKNVADTSTISATSTNGTTSVANLKKDPKSLIWRSVGNTATLTVTLAEASIVGGVILPYTNLSASALITVTLNTGYTTGPVLACPYQGLAGWDWGSVPLGVNGYSQGNSSCARVWFPLQSCTSMTIAISDTGVTNIEASRLVIGSYWSPTYNTTYGLAMQQQDTTEHQRAESGDILTTNGITYASMNFELSWLQPSDRLQLSAILKGNRKINPVFISLFPDNDTDWAKEQLYQIYGKLSNLSAITNNLPDMYQSSVEIEEI